MPPQRPSETRPEPTSTPSSLSHRIIAGILLFGAIAVPLFISRNGDDHFRLPKDLLLIAVAVAAAGTAAAAAALGRLAVTADDRRRLRLPLILTAAGVAWSAIAALASTNRLLSGQALIWIASLASVFLLAALTIRRVPMWIFAVAVLLPSVVDAALVIVQALGVWNPWIFPPDTQHRMMKNGLQGNPDYVGVYMIAPLLFAAAASLTAQRKRALYGVAAGLLGVAVIATETFSAVGALVVALVALAYTRTRRLTVAAAIAAALAIGVVATVLAYPPLRARVTALAASASQGVWNDATRGRLVPVYSALQMFAEHPLTGVGPGCFKFNYMPYRVRIEDRHPSLTATNYWASLNYAEVHNDHVQILAEAGGPGLIIVLAGFVVFARRSLEDREDDDQRSRLAALLTIPLVVMIAVVMIPQFPWSLASAAYMYALIGGACVSWRSSDVA